MTTWSVPDDIDYDTFNVDYYLKYLPNIKCAHESCDSLPIADSDLCMFHEEFYEWIANMALIQHSKKGKTNEQSAGK